MISTFIVAVVEKERSVHHNIDYAEFGLIAGLEAHQQLLTERKMFCHWPAGFYTEMHDGIVLRHMRPTLSGSTVRISFNFIKSTEYPGQILLLIGAVNFISFWSSATAQSQG